MAINVNKPVNESVGGVVAQTNAGRDIPTGDRSSQFSDISVVKRRLIVVASALQKHGKDHFGFTGPGPIALHAFDEGWEDTAAKFRKQGKAIKVVEYDVPEATDKKRNNSLADEADRIWSNFVSNYRWSLDNFKTVILDTATEMWELLRLARFGALSTGQTTSFGPVNAEFRKLIREAYNHNANVIFLQKLGKKYVNREWDGSYEPKGFGDMAYEAQVVVRLYREDPNVFHALIQDCRQEPMLNGLDLSSADIVATMGDRLALADDGVNTFPVIASLIHGDTPEDWR